MQGNVFIQDLSYDTLQIFCIRLRKADFIKAIVAKENDKANGPLLVTMLDVHRVLKKISNIFIYMLVICNYECGIY